MKLSPTYEHASTEDDSRYRLLVDSITDYAIYMLDENGFITSWNAGSRRLYGYTSAEVVGRHFSELYPEGEREDGLPARALHRAREDHRYEGEGWRIAKDGTRLWVNVVIDAVIGPAGLIGYAKVTRDLTKQKLAQDALIKSEEQFRLLVQSVTDYAIFMLSPEGIITNWNAGAERIKGYKPSEIIGQHFSKFYSPEEAAAGVPQIGLDTAAREGRFEKEGWRYRKDGTKFWANVVIDSIRAPDGELIGYAKITRDMTERKQAQEQVEIVRESMAQSQKLEAIGKLTGGVAHDFNNLLMAVLGSLELIRKRLPADPKLAILLNNAFAGARRGVSLSQRMLSFARRQELTLQAVDIRSLVMGMADMLGRSLGPMVAIDMNIPVGLPSVKADTNQLETALLNLVVNARDAMPEGGTISIFARHEATFPSMGAGEFKSECVVLTVRDSGEGMDTDTLSRATEPFFTTKGIGKGTGLGLSMVHGTMEQLGGRLHIESHLGKGTTVDLWLPLADEQAFTAVGESPALPAEVNRRALSIIVVDDDALVLSNTMAMLEDAGHSVTGAGSAAIALSLIRAAPSLDLVVTDQAMPQMTGVQLASAISAEWPRLPVLLMSGYAELPVQTPPGLRKLAKPFSLNDLEEAVAKTVQGSSASEKFDSSYRR